MHFPRFDYIEPKTLGEAAAALALDGGGSSLLAGGTDLLVLMKHRLIEPKRIVNLKAIPNLAYISTGKDGLRIGTLTTLHELASSPLLQERYPAISYAAGEAGAYVHQVSGTLGGNLCQANRCRYYNQTAFWRNVKTPCYKAGGQTCHIVRKQGECHAAYCGDLAPVLVALDAQIKVVSPNEKRTFPLIQLYTQEGKEPLALRKGEIIEEILVPPPSGRTVYLKLRLRDSIDFPVISLAVSLNKDKHGVVRRAKVVFSAVGCGPVEAPNAAKTLEGITLSQEQIEKVAIGVVKETTAMRTSLTSPAYKRRMAQNLLRQALETLRDESQETELL